MPSRRLIDALLNHRGAGHEAWRGCVLLEQREGRDGHASSARVVFALADGRPVALIFPAGRRVVHDRIGKLLGADEVSLSPVDEVHPIGDDREAEPLRPMPDPQGISLLMDATLLSARALEIETCEDGPVRLTLEDWLAAANPRLGFFTEPDRGPN
jgi:hypothetical protein